MSNPLLELNTHPGKFEGEIHLTEKLYDVTLDSGEDESLGDADTFGYYSLFLNLNNGEFDNLGGIVAAIVHTNSQGFVEGTYYDDEDTARKIWRNLERQWEKMLETEMGED